MVFKYLVLTWALFMAWLCLYPFEFDDNSAEFWEHTDKIVHVLMHAILAVLSALSLKGLKTRGLGFFYVFLSCVIYGTILEVFQKILPTHRSFDWLDILANILGALIGLTIFLKAKNIVKSQVDEKF